MNIIVYINGRKRYVRDRITVFEACREAGEYIPHFCYHPKLSIAANCRMCLVQIEKSPKPVPSCATYVTDGMRIHTNSEQATNAQKGVMEFLLVNHPLDCPICDQGGECQLQDLAVGYGKSCARFGETKRVVVEKQLGPLISTVMTRCIHCTRCVRFGEEIAGRQELGMPGRGEHSEIMPFLETTVDSELSGNMIDICPVGALNSKPYRFTARTWEMDRSDGVSQHDGWGSMITIQSIDNMIKRVLPKEHEEINECWISDRDRFAYTGLDTPERLRVPLVRDRGSLKPRQVEWPEALEAATAKIRTVVDKHGPEQVGLLIGPSSTSEECLLASDLIRGLGSSNIDNRLRQKDFSLDTHLRGVPWLGCTIEDISKLDSILLIGTNPACELPLLSVRIRNGQKNGKNKIATLCSRSLDGQFRVAKQILAPPSAWLSELAKLLAAAGSKADIPDWIWELGVHEDRHAELIDQLSSGKTAIFLGNEARLHESFGALYLLAGHLAKTLGGIYGVLVEAPNTIGGSLAGAVPARGFMREEVKPGGLNARRMIEDRLKAYITINCEPLDFGDPAAALAAFADAETVHIGGYFDKAREYADVLLPAALFAERTGALVNLEGNAATTVAAVDPPGEARPAWKILRALGESLGVAGFDFATLGQVRERLISAGDFGKLILNGIKDGYAPTPPDHATGERGSGMILERCLDKAHFATDQILRRAQPLQDTTIAKDDEVAHMHPFDLGKLQLSKGQQVELNANGAMVKCEVKADADLAQGCIRCPLGVQVFAELGNASAIEVVPAREQVEKQAEQAAA